MNGIQSALEPAGIHADRIGTLWDVFLIVSVIVYVLVMLFLALALIRRPAAARPRRVLTGVVVASSLTVAVMFGLLVASIFTGRAIADSPSRAAPTSASPPPTSSTYR
jgi:cytochrome c oxidase subunit 2